jgi:hypothetical protein
MVHWSNVLSLSAQKRSWWGASGSLMSSGRETQWSAGRFEMSVFHDWAGVINVLPCLALDWTVFKSPMKHPIAAKKLWIDMNLWMIRAIPYDPYDPYHPYIIIYIYKSIIYPLLWYELLWLWMKSSNHNNPWLIHALGIPHPWLRGNLGAKWSPKMSYERRQPVAWLCPF